MVIIEILKSLGLGGGNHGRGGGGGDYILEKVSVLHVLLNLTQIMLR